MNPNNLHITFFLVAWLLWGGWLYGTFWLEEHFPEYDWRKYPTQIIVIGLCIVSFFALAIISGIKFITFCQQ